MPGNRDWVDYGGLFLNLCTLGATVAIAWFVQSAGTKSDNSKLQASHYETCYANQFKLAQALCQGNDCAPPTAGQLKQLSYFYTQVKDYCASGIDDQLSISISGSLQEAFAQASATAPKDTSVEVRAQVAAAIASSPQAPVETLAVPPSPLASSAQAQSAGNPNPLLFVQIYSDDEKEQAKNFIRAVTGIPFMQGRLQALGPETVRTAVTETQLRCTKRSDCQHAQELALYLGQVLGTKIPVFDISAKYGSATAKYGPRFELWFKPGPIQVASPSDAASAGSGS